MSYNVGDTVTLDGIESIIIYKADIEQEWGQYIIVDKNHDLCYYIDGDDYTNQDLPVEDSKYGYEWGALEQILVLLPRKSEMVYQIQIL